MPTQTPNTSAGQAKEAAAKPKTIPVKALADFWDENGERQPKDTIVELPIKAAKKLISEGKAERADPLPGE